MKLKNILSVFSLLALVVSCSMDDETVMNDINKEIQNEAEAYAYFDLNLVGEGSITKSAEFASDERPNAHEGSISNCYLAVFDTDTKQLLNSFFYVTETIKPVSGAEDTYSLGSHIQMKVSKEVSKRPNLTFVAIANLNPTGAGSSLTALKACGTYDDLMNATIIENPRVVVKKGETAIQKTAYRTSSSISNHDEYCTTVTIPVYQRSAAVELSSFAVVKAGSTTETLDVTDVQFNLYNANLYTKVNAGSMDTDYIGTYYSFVDKGERLYTYENTTSEKAYIIVSYKVNDVPAQTRPLYIETPGKGEQVLANHLYKLNVTVTNGVATATCTVANLIENTVSGEWTEVNK